MKLILLLCTLLIFSCTYDYLPVEENILECEPNMQFYTSNIKPILDVHCSGCHYQGSGRALLENYDDVIYSIEYDNLLFWITSSQMPPYGSQPFLSDQDRQILTNWINCE